MRIVLILSPRHRRGYSDMAALDAIGRGEKAILLRGANGVSAVNVLRTIDAVAVYEDLPVTDDMCQLIVDAVAANIPVERRRLPIDRISVIDRPSLAA
jgi:hypothetical protein